MPAVRRLLLLTTLATALAGAGCGGDDGVSAGAFCDEVQGVVDKYDGGKGGEGFGAAIGELQQIEPPGEIADDYRTVLDAYEDENADPAKVDAAAKRLQPWLEDNCGVDLSS